MCFIGYIYFMYLNNLITLYTINFKTIFMLSPIAIFYQVKHQFNYNQFHNFLSTVITFLKNWTFSESLLILFYSQLLIIIHFYLFKFAEPTSCFKKGAEYFKTLVHQTYLFKTLINNWDWKPWLFSSFNKTYRKSINYY